LQTADFALLLTARSASKPHWTSGHGALCQTPDHAHQTVPNLKVSMLDVIENIEDVFAAKRQR
jgi:hypothetical protein